MSGHEDYSRNSGPAPKRQRTDPMGAGHWASAPTDRRSGGNSSMNSRRHNNNDDDFIDDDNQNFDGTSNESMNAARHGVSAFFQTATDEEMRGFNQSLRVFQK